MRTDRRYKTGHLKIGSLLAFIMAAVMILSAPVQAESLTETSDTAVMGGELIANECLQTDSLLNEADDLSLDLLAPEDMGNENLLSEDEDVTGSDLVPEGIATEDELSGTGSLAAAAKSPAVKGYTVNGVKTDNPLKGVTADGWEYEYLDARDGKVEGLASGEYMLLKGYKGVCTEVVVPSNISVQIINNDGTVVKTDYRTVIRGGKKTRTKFPAGVIRISFDGSTLAMPDLSWLFSGYKQLEVIDVTGLDTSAVTNMSNLFSNCKKLVSVDGTQSLDARGVKDVSSLFAKCSSIDWLRIGLWECSPTNITSMVQGCSNLNYLSLQTWDFSGITQANSKNAFSGTTSLYTFWTPLYIPPDFSIQLSGTYSIWESVTQISAYPRTAILAPAGQSKFYMLSRSIRKAKDDDGEGNRPGDKRVEGVNLDRSYVVLEHKKGAPKKCLLTATISPEDAVVKDLVWSTTDKKVVTVNPMEDGNAEIITVGPGFADVTVTTRDGGFTASCSVTVKCYSDFIEESRGDENEDKGGTPDYELIAGQSYDLYSYLDSLGVFNNKDKKCITGFSIVSTNPSAVVSSSSGMLTAKGAGIGFLGCSYKDHNKPRQYTIMGTRIRVWKPRFNTNTVNLTYVGQTFKGAENIIYNSCPIKPTSWKSTKPDVATVDPEGNVVAKGKGTTKIEVTWTNNQDFSAVYSFTVKVQTPKLSKTQLKLVTGETNKIKVSNIPKDTQVVWKLTNTAETGRDCIDSEDSSGDVVTLGYDKLGHTCTVMGALPGDVFVTAVIDGYEYDCYVEVPRPELKFTGNALKLENTKLPAGTFRFESLSPWILDVNAGTGALYRGSDFPNIPDDSICTIRACCLNNDGTALIILSQRVRTRISEGKNGKPVQYVYSAD